MSQQPIPAPTPALNLDNIQGDILSGLPKKTQTYLFFQIRDVPTFRQQLTQLVPLIKTVNQVLADRKAIEDHKKNGGTGLIPMVGINIAFSHFGFQAMGINDDSLTVDTAFKNGQRFDAGAILGEAGTGTGADFDPTNWDPSFKQQIDGMLFASGDSHDSVNKAMAQIEQIFGLKTPASSIVEVTRIVGDVRPDLESGHEHFGFLDGISNPSVIGFDQNPAPGPKPIRAGIMLTGEDGDANLASREPWSVDGSYLVFRYLFQMVPEFDDFLDQNPVNLPGLTHEQATELFGARLLGRWKSGAPIDLAPFQDDPELAEDPNRNNNFHFTGEKLSQTNCPFAAHVRKTNPRDDLEAQGTPIEKHRITRRGVQFGPEVTQDERAAKTTQHGRGLLFACYQSSITDGFQFLQQSWANNPGFPPNSTTIQPGLDPVIGQGPSPRSMSGTNPNDPAALVTRPGDFVIPRGGEHFFAPSLSGLKDTIAVA